jgi:DNA-binding Lrp family transcriptional regulator
MVNALPILAYVLFKVASGTEREVAEKLTEFEEVMTADVVFGEYDVIARISTGTLSLMEDFVSRNIRVVPNVLVTSTMIIGKEYSGKCSHRKNK